MEDKRVADYFVVAGLSDNPAPLDEFSRDGNSPKTTQLLLPITDITVIIRNQGEMIPKGYHCIETTPFGFPADVNHGSLRSPNIYVCYRRGKDKPPLVDVGVLYDGKERVMSDSEVVLTTHYGRSANVNNSGSRTFITYRRAPDNAPCNQLVVTDICVILANKGEHPPRAFCLIEKNLNKGMLGSDVYLCYKKSMNRPDYLSYKPAVLGRFPLEDYENFPMPQSVPLFCLPMGATIECWPKNVQHPKPVFSTFVLTSDTAEKVYGAAVTFYEQFPENKLTESMKSLLVYTTTEHKKAKSLFTNKSICILSRWPFFDTFEKFLRYLHRMSVSGPHKVPLERIISHFMLEVPFPSPQRPRILIQLADCTVSLAQPEDTPLPLTGASFVQLLKNLGPDNCIKVLLYALAEQKICFHSLRPDVLTSVAEAVVMLIFPFHWQCPYIPLCPLGLSDVLCAPLPFIIGVDSRYFDLFDPPQDVTCIDLDTNAIFLSEDKRGLNIKLLPKRPARLLKNALQNLYEKLGSIRNVPNSKATATANSAFLDYDFKIKKKEHHFELEIQEAFLRFMASILKGYRNFLKPITAAPTIGTTDANSLFDLNGFSRSRDKTYSRFFSLMMKTQMFIRFIEERSFVSDKDVSLAFFDECTEKIDAYDGIESKFLEIDDSHTSDRTVFIAPPEPIGLPPGLDYKYKQFGTLKPQLFHKHPSKTLLSIFSQNSPTPSSPMARRTKQEIKTAQRMARKQSETPVMWAKCLAGYCFSLWFIHLPAFVKSAVSKSHALRVAFDVLVCMQHDKLSPPDEVCYRVLMLLCGLYSQPTLAVKVLFEMKRNGVQPNAITYGYYNKAVLESKWPSANCGSTLMWNKLRNVVIGVAQFRKGVKRKTRRSLSLCSELDYDRISRTSIDSANQDSIAFIKVQNPTEFVTDLVKLVDDRSCAADPDEICDHRKNDLSKDSSESSLLRCSTEGTVNASNCEENGNKLCASKSLKFREIDFTASDAFRSRVGSIVKSSATSIGSLSQIQDTAVDSAAGILMTSHTSILENGISDACDRESRRRHKSAGEHKCNHRNYKLRHCSGPLSEDLEEMDAPSPFLRSYSFGNDVQIMRKIREGKDVVVNSSLPPKVSDPLIRKKTVIEKKKDDKDQKTKPCVLTRCDEETELEESLCDTSTLKNGCQRSRSPSLILTCRNVTGRTDQSPARSDGSSDTFSADVSSDTLVSEEISENLAQGKIVNSGSTNHVRNNKDFLSTTFSPLKDAFMNFDLFSGSRLPRMATNISNSLGLGGSGISKSPSSRSGRVTRSSTFHNGARNAPVRAKSQTECSTDFDMSSGKKSLSRSSTLPVTPRSNSVSSNKLPGAQPSSKLFLVSPSTFGISQLTSRHSEVFLDSLKSAVTSVSCKINELRSSLSASNTPVKGQFNSSSNQSESDRLPMYGSDDRIGIPCDGRRGSIDCLSGSSHSSDVFITKDYYLKEACRNHDQRHSMPHVGSAPVFSSQVYDMLEKRSESYNDQSSVLKTALEITMTTCSRCFTCSSLLYDEEIMEGWSADDSNLNTQCAFCKAKLVPSLTVNVRDFRWEGSSESLLTPAYSNESVRSAPICFLPSSYDGNSFPNRPRLLGEKGSTRNSSIDSSNEAFILFEDSPGNDENVSYNNVKNKKLQTPPSSSMKKSMEDGIDVTKDVVSSYSSRNSNSSLFEDTGFCSSLPSTDAKGSQQSPSTCSSVGDVRKLSSNIHSHAIEPITVPYLSPLVLRKEMENVLEHEGDHCLTKPEFVDQHPIIYWNVIWFFKRIGVPSHLPSLALEAEVVTKGKQIPDVWQKADYKNILIHCAWDNVKLHEDMGQPLYVLWKQNENGGEQSSLVHALVTEERKGSKSVINQVLNGVRCNDLYSPICTLVNERRKCSSVRRRHHSIYREILFMSFIAVGRENVDNLSFDVEYRRAFSSLSNKELSQMHRNDKPPSEGAVFCRHYFKDLELRLA